MIPLKLTVNGRAVDTAVAPSTLLIDLLRGPLVLTGTHAGCDTAQCGACTVLVIGTSVKSCSLLAVQAQGAQVTTVEGLVVAIPALAVFAIFRNRIDGLVAEVAYCAHHVFAPLRRAAAPVTRRPAPPAPPPVAGPA